MRRASALIALLALSTTALAACGGASKEGPAVAKPAAAQTCEEKTALACRDACGAGNAACCERAGDLVLLERARGPKRALAATEALGKACDAGRAHACHKLARLVMYGVPGALEPDAFRALALARKACDGGDRSMNASMVPAKDARSTP